MQQISASALTIVGGVASLLSIGAIATALFAKQRVPRWNFEATTALVIGGSTGIGLETARELVRKRVKHVVIAARREEVLKKAVEDLRGTKDAVHSPTEVYYVVMDVCSDESVNSAVAEAERLCGSCPISLLMCNAGFATPTRFLDSTMRNAEQMMQTNFFGCLRAMWAVMPKMVAQRRGRVVLTSSLAALAPIAGYTLYAGTKAGLRALAHSADMENSCFGVRVQVVSPPDVDTPGFDSENEVKSPECRAISELGGAKPFTAEAMAKAVVAGIDRYQFDITLGFDGAVLRHTCAGMEPPTSVCGLLLETASIGVLRLILAVYAKLHYNIVYRIRCGEGKGDKKNQ